MMFDIDGYLKSVSRSLNLLEENQIILFSSWCSQALVNLFGEALKARIGKKAEFLLNTIGHIWGTVIRDEPLNTGEVEEAMNICLHSNWNSDDEDDAVDFAATQTLESLLCTFTVARNPSSRIGSETAERVINWIDYELTMIKGVENPYQHKLFLEEIERQRKMLTWIGQSKGKYGDDVKNMFR